MEEVNRAHQAEMSEKKTGKPKYKNKRCANKREVMSKEIASDQVH